MILNDDNDDYQGFNVSDISNYSFLTRVNIDVWANISKLLLLKCKYSKYIKITKTIPEFQNYHFKAIQSLK